MGGHALGRIAKDEGGRGSMGRVSGESGATTGVARESSVSRPLVCSLGVALAAALVAGCGSASLLLKRPIADQCASRGLKSCPELTEAVLDYVDGDKAAAEPKLRAAVAENEPEQLRAFAAAIEPLADTAGGDTGATLKAVIAIMKGEAPGGGAPAEKAASAATGKAAAAGGAAASGTVALAPPSDSAENLRSGVSAAGADPRAMPCGEGPIAGDVALCKKVRLAVGPLVVTNVYASGGCPDELFVMAGTSDRPQWVLLAPSSGLMNVSGRFVVDDGIELVAGTRSGEGGPRADVRCMITWAGYRL
jgi:hypothetical protein